jgi:hypothetical protein
LVDVVVPDKNLQRITSLAVQRTLNEQEPALSVTERAALPFQYIRGTAADRQRRGSFSRGATSTRPRFHPTMSLEKGPAGPIYKAQGQSIHHTYALISAMQDAIADRENYIRRFSHGEIMAERRRRLDREREKRFPKNLHRCRVANSLQQAQSTALPDDY